MAVRILCDSCADLPEELLRRHNITLIPLTVAFGQESFKANVELSTAEFYDRLTREKTIPTTSQVTPAEYAAVFTQAVADGGEAVYVGLSSGLSGSMQSAFLAASAPELGGRVHVVDSLGASLGLGLMVLRAADLAAAGMDAAAIAADIASYRERVCHVFTLDTLEYARRGGRVSAFSAVAANLLDVKPVLTVNMEGKLIPFDRVRGRKRSLNRLFDEVERLGVNMAGQRVAISHAQAAAETQEAAERFRSQYGVAEVVISDIGPVVGAHVGPGCVAMFFEGPAGRGE